MGPMIFVVVKTNMQQIKWHVGYHRLITRPHIPYRLQCGFDKIQLIVLWSYDENEA